MHTTNLPCGWTANHNGDFSGEVFLRPQGGQDDVVIPFDVLAALVAEKIRRDRIAALENMTTGQLLDRLPK